MFVKPIIDMDVLNKAREEHLEYIRLEKERKD